MKKKVINKEDQLKIDMVAEQLARLFIEQAKWKRATKIERQEIEKLNNKD